MTALSVLKSVDELETVSIRLLPFPTEERLHPDYEWVYEEYTKWAKKFPDYNQTICNYITYLVCSVHIRCPSKERLLSLVKLMENGFAIDLYLTPILKERSSEKAQQLIYKVIRALKTGEFDQDFTMGKRLLESLEDFKRDATIEELKTVEMHLEMGFKAHLDIVCNYSLRNQFIPLKDYVYKRSRESMWTLIVWTSGYSLDYQMPNTVRSNQLVEEFKEKAIELALATDDYYMVKVKLMTNDITSRVICYLNEKRCSLQEAIDQQFRYVMDLHKECKQLMDKISSDRELSSDKLKDWMTTALENSYAVFKILRKYQKFEVRADQTVHSERWEQLFRGIKDKTDSNSDPFDLNSN